MVPQNQFEIVQGPSRWDVLLESAINRDRKHTFKIKNNNKNVEISMTIDGVIWSIPQLSTLMRKTVLFQDSDEKNIVMLWGHTGLNDIVAALRPNRQHCHFTAFYDVHLRAGQITFITKPYQLIVSTLTEPPLMLDGFFAISEASSRFCHIPDQVIKEYKQAIIASPDATDFCKQTLFWLIEKSEKFTNPVAISFTENKDLGRGVAFGHHDMVSANCRTHLDRIEKELGIPMTFSNHGGCFADNEFKTEFNGYTIWLSYKYYDRNVHVFYDTTEVMAEISAIQLTA